MTVTMFRLPASPRSSSREHPAKRPQVRLGDKFNNQQPMSEQTHENVETIGQAWCLCPWEWGVDDYVTVDSSVGTLALCNVQRVLVQGMVGTDAEQLRYVPVKRGEIHDLSNP